MNRKAKPEPDDPKQSQRFIDTAREREADESKEGADRAFKELKLSKRQDRDSKK